MKPEAAPSTEPPDRVSTASASSPDGAAALADLDPKAVLEPSAAPTEATAAPVLHLEELVEMWTPNLYRFAVRWTGSAADAEDLVQETFLVAQRKITQLRDPNCAFGWLLKILRSCARQLRQQRPPCQLAEAALCAAVEPESLPAGGQHEWVDPDWLLEELQLMPTEFREPLLLYYFRELRYKDIATILSCPLGTVMSRLARAKAMLRERLERRALQWSSRRAKVTTSHPMPAAAGTSAEQMRSSS